MSGQQDVPVPPGVARLPRDRHGYPIPWFVDVDDGVPDFRVVRRGGLSDAIRFDVCWVCGQRRGRHAAFVIGPMCAVNRVSPEPPSHLDCAVYAARACPFLSTPTMHRRDRGLPADRVDPAGQAILRNPGVALVWSSRTWRPFPAPRPDGTPGVLFAVGEPTQVSWWAQGRPATRAEVEASMVSGLPLLEAETSTEDERAQLAAAAQDARSLLPA